MYRNLQAEMARSDINRKKLSQMTGIKYSTISDKLNGKTRFEFDEALKIKKVAFPDLTLEYLFHKDERELMNSTNE